jgi:hypothetical protein
VDDLAEDLSAFQLTVLLEVCIRMNARLTRGGLMVAPSQDGFSSWMNSAASQRPDLSATTRRSPLTPESLLGESLGRAVRLAAVGLEPVLLDVGDRVLVPVLLGVAARACQ